VRAVCWGALIGLASCVSCGKEGKKGAVQAVPVVAMHVVAATIPAQFEYVGVAESSHIVELRARVEGYLEKIGYQEGTLVDDQALLFVLDQRSFVDALNMALAELSRQEALHWNAVQSKNRMEPLYKLNAVSQKDYDNAVAEEWATKSSVMAAAAAVEKAKLNLSFCSIQAPVKGWVSKAIFREGALISPGPDSLLANLYVLDPIWVNFSVSDGDILKAREETQNKLLILPQDKDFSIEIVMADGSIMPAKGKIDFTAPDIQQNTGTMLVRSVVANPNAILRPGQFVKVLVKGAIRPNAIIVPQTAVSQGQNGSYVYVINQEGLASIRMIETGDWYHDYWVINSGLKDGEVVVADGVNRVQNNTPVRITTWLPSAPKTSSTPEIPSLGL
jgi:membrane fusion protein (multidrug efflux system)